MLEKAKLIKLASCNNPTILDISANPKQLKIVEIESPQIPRVLDDIDCGITNTDWVMLAEIDPNISLINEGKDPQYANIIVIRNDNMDDKDIKQFISIYHSENIKNFIIKEFQGDILPAW